MVYNCHQKRQPCYELRIGGKQVGSELAVTEGGNEKTET